MKKRVRIILISLAVMCLISYIIYKQFLYTPPGPQTYLTQQICEEATKKACSPSLCDVKCPRGFEKGWVATSKGLSDEDPKNNEAFIDKEFNIRISHPNHWNVNSGINGAEGEGTWWQLNVNYDRHFNAELTREDNPDNLTPEGWFDIKEKAHWNKYTTKITSPPIDGRPSLILGLPDTCKSAPWFVVFIKDKNYMYELTYMNIEEDSRVEELETILKDFYFIDEGESNYIPNVIPEINVPSAPTGIVCDN